MRCLFLLLLSILILPQQTKASVMEGMGLGPQDNTSINLSGTYWGESRPTVIEQVRASVSVPVWSKEGKSFALSAGASGLFLNERQKFRDDLYAPKELHRLELGGHYRRSLKDKALLGIRASVGSASDRPFHSQDETTFSLASYYTKKGESKGQWFWTVFMSNNNPVANYVPIPGFIYLYKHEDFTGLFGLPFFSLQWGPADPWLLSVSLFLTNLNMEIAYGRRNELQLFGGLSSTQQSYLREGREELKDRLFFKEKKAFLGMRSPLTKSVSFELQGGQSFDRKLEEGRRFNDTDLEADLGRSWFAAAGINVLI